MLMQQKKKFNPASLALTLPACMVLACLIMCAMNTYLGYSEFKSIFEDEYYTITTQFAQTAASYVNGDSIARYKENPVADEEWEETNQLLDTLTETSDLAYIYVTVNDPDYTWRMYIYDTVNKKVVNGSVIPLGKVLSLTNKSEEYIDNMRTVMEDGNTYTSYAYNKETGGHVTTSVPIFDSTGKVAALLGVVKPMSEVKEIQTRYLHSSIVGFIMFSLVFITIFVVILQRTLIKPIVTITDETAHFAEHKAHLTGALKNFTQKSELGILARSVEQMSVDMNTYIDELTRNTAEKERLSAELDVATQIQANMLPRIFPPYKDHPEIELYASMAPAKEVGGDYYDFFMIDDDHFAVVVGDVSGKGVPAALFMVIAKTIIKNEALQGYSPAKVFELVNAQLCEGNDAGLFVTCWLGVLTLSTGQLVFANAGHASPVWWHDNKEAYLVTKPNLMLAGMEGIPYTDHTVTLQRGDRLFLYTDGVTEATDADGNLYGEERLLKALRATDRTSPKDVLSSVNADIHGFVGSAPQFDDITMLEFSLRKNNA